MRRGAKCRGKGRQGPSAKEGGPWPQCREKGRRQRGSSPETASQKAKRRECVCVCEPGRRPRKQLRREEMGEVKKNKVGPETPTKKREGSPGRPPPTLRRSSLISFEGDDENSRVEVRATGR